MVLEFINSDIYTWIIIPLLIFIARVLDVSMGTIRVIFITRGNKLLAPLLGFFEVLIWLAAIQQIFTHLDNIMCFIAYAGGFAVGTFAGISIEDKISIGTVMIRIITGKDATELINSLKKAGYEITYSDARSPDGKVKNILTVTKRQNIPDVIAIVKKHNPNAFYSIEDVRYAREEVKRKKLLGFGFLRKSK